MYKRQRYLRSRLRIRQRFVKRVVGLPGETVEIRDGVVYIDGRPLREPYLDPRRNRRPHQMPPLTLGQREVFVLGDNRGHSTDSRFQSVGMVDQRNILGKVVFNIYPFSNLGFVS